LITGTLADDSSIGVAVGEDSLADEGVSPASIGVVVGEDPPPDETGAEEVGGCKDGCDTSFLTLLLPMHPIQSNM